MLRLLRLALVLVFFAGPLAAQVARTPEPDWIEPAELTELPAALMRHVDKGEAFVLLDRQIRWQDGRRQTYIRIASQAVNRAGVERVASVARDFDPEIETLTLVRLDIVRDGKTIPLAERVQPTVVRRETQLDAGIIDGTLTAHYELPGVRVGDIVDAAFLWDGGSYLPDLNREVSLDLEYSVPVAETRLIVHWPDDLVPHVTAPPELLVAMTDEPGGTRMEWRRAAMAPRQRESRIPDPDSTYDRVLITPHSDWESVSAPLTEFYTRPRAVPGAWASRLAEIRDSIPDPAARAYAVLHLVQDEIRYVGLEVGAGGYYARSPDQVVAQGFGDCKDKALLLKTLLNGLGIEAEVALADTENGDWLDRAPPMQSTFDHMIAGARLDGRWVFMDPTLTHQGGGPDTAVGPNLGYVLPVTEGRDDLVQSDDDNRLLWFTSLTESFDFGFAGVRLDVETVHRGASAAYVREDWERNAAVDLGERYLDYYADTYPGITQTSDPVLADDRARDVVTIRESYLIPRAALHADALWHEFPFVQEFSYNGYPVPAEPRRWPLVVSHPGRSEHHIRVRNAPINFKPPEPETIETTAFQTTFSARAPGEGALDLDWVYQTRARLVPADQVDSVLAGAVTARDLSSWTWDLGEEGWYDRLMKSVDKLPKVNN